jgi:hypothetical protein
MGSVPYNYIGQPVVSTALIQQMDDDSFYFPSQNGHTGFAFDGQHYTNGVQDLSPPTSASWYTEGPGAYRGASARFPSYGLALLGRASLTILDESTPDLALWMTFLLEDGLMLANNFALDNPDFSSPPALDLMGFLPKGLAYANGVISVVYSPDPGSEAVTSGMAVNVDFARDTAYLDVAV